MAANRRATKPPNVSPSEGRDAALDQLRADLESERREKAELLIENARLFQELQESNRMLSEALDRQTATTDILRVISSSPTDLQPVLDTIIADAIRLCGAESGAIRLLEGSDLVAVAAVGARRLPLGGRIPLSTRAPTTAAVNERRTIHIHDMRADYPESPAARVGVRTFLAVPLLHQGEPAGVFQLTLNDTRPFTDGQVALVETFAEQAVIAIQNTRLVTELRQRDDRRRHELERAASIQQRLLPSLVEGWPGVLEVAVRFRAAVETSGDFYDVLALPAGRKGGLEPLQIALGDVAGKGMSAALVTALARSALRASVTVPTEMVTPAGTLRLAGRRLHDDVGSGHFVACALAVVEPPGLLNAGPLLRASNAAQVPVLLVRDGGACEIEPPGDRLPLGARPDGAYEDARVELRPGDVVLFSSDGLVEAPARAAAMTPTHFPPATKMGELFGFARLAASAAHWSTHAHTAEAVAEGIWSDLTAWCGNESHHDDMTLLVLRVPPPRAS